MDEQQQLEENLAEQVKIITESIDLLKQWANEPNLTQEEIKKIREELQYFQNKIEALLALPTKENNLPLNE